MSKTELYAAKITRPVPRDCFLRERLFDALDGGMGHPLVWVSGPPGSGKTTLATSYIEARGVNCLWYQVDEGDSDLATFFYYMGLAARKAAPRKKKPLPLLTPEYMMGVPTFARRFFEELFSRLKPPCLLVLDNYQEAAPDGPLHEVVSTGLSVLPKGVSVLVLSRSGAPTPFARLRANGLMEELGWDKMKLSVEESRGMLRLMRDDLTDNSAKRIHESCGGWAAGLVLMARAVSAGGGIGSMMQDGRAPEDIFDYFASEVIDKADGDTSVFMMQTSLFPDFTPEMAEALTGIEGAGRLLSALHRENFFTHRRYMPGLVYQYHPLFREFLVKRAREVFSASELASLERRAAGLLEAAGRVEAAAELFISSGDWDGLALLISANAPAMLAQGRNKVLEGWLVRVPEGTLESNPWLMYWLGASRLMFAPAMSRRYLEKAFHMFRKSASAAGVYLSWSGIVDSIIFESDDFNRLDEWASLLEGLQREFGDFPGDNIGARVAFSIFQALVMTQPGHKDVEEWGRLALDYSERCKDPVTRSMTLFCLMFLRINRGEPAAAKFVLDSLQSFDVVPDPPPLTLLYTRMTETLYYMSDISHEDCLNAISRGVEIGRSSGIVMHNWHMTGNAALSALNAGDFQMARRLLDEMASSLSRANPWDRAFFHFLKATEAFLNNELRLADNHMDQALVLIDRVGVRYSKLTCHIGKAQIMQKLGEYGHAAAQIEKSMEIARRDDLIHAKYLCMLAKAQLDLEQGREAEGMAALREAMKIGREKGYQNWMVLWCTRPADLAMLCVKALEAGIEVDFVREMVRVRGLEPDEPPVHVDGWPWPVRIYTLGRFSVLTDGSPVNFSGKVQKKPMAMLKALIALGGREVSEDSLAEALWPDADGDFAHRSFATTLHRLRKLLGREGLLQVSEGRLTLNPKLCWVDAWALERSLAGLEEAIKPGEVRDSTETAICIEKAERALGLYRGSFLGDVNETWVYPSRERLRSRFIRANGRLSAFWQDAGEYAVAAECCHRALDVDELAEEFYQRLMECHLAMGRRAEAVTTFNRCRDALLGCLGIEPSEKTQEIYQSAIKK